YRHRNDGSTIDTRNFIIDNRWVVPHNLYLCTKYHAHINVKICSSISAVKYLFKYVYKGHDRASIEMTSTDNAEQPVDLPNEIKLYLDARYVSASEASWRIFHYRLRDEKPDIQRLQVHLPNQQNIIFGDDEPFQDVLQRPNIEKTMLTEWFTANRRYIQARDLTYGDFPKKWVWKKSSKQWQL